VDGQTHSVEKHSLFLQIAFFNRISNCRRQSLRVIEKWFVRHLHVFFGAHVTGSEVQANRPSSMNGLTPLQSVDRSRDMWKFQQVIAQKIRTATPKEQVPMTTSNAKTPWPARPAITCWIDKINKDR